MRDGELCVSPSLRNHALITSAEQGRLLTNSGLGFVREIEDLKFTKLIRSNLSLASSVIREQDIRLALLRASVGTRSEQNPTLERIRFNLEKGPLRPFLSTLSSSTSAFHASTSGMGTPDLFASHLLGTPVRATFTVPWPLDLFLTPAATSVYSLVFSYLAALRRTHTRVLACWLGLSGAQRTRRRWTSVGEGGAEEAEARKRLARQGWGMVRLMLWFLDSVIAHFQVS
jgi:gamma-tubulin complex component 4